MQKNGIFDMQRSGLDDGHVMDSLEEKGEHTALICGDGRHISYVELAGLADAFGRDLRAQSGRDRGVLLIEMRNTAEAVIAYAGAVRARWPVILATEGTTVANSDLVTRFGPDLVYRSIGTNWHLVPSKNAATPHELHPELAVMLSTSGSTGSTKLVRLSRTNIHENARSIAEYLEIDASRVAVTSLPIHYSYGLSVINSFLLAGGSVVLTEASVVDDDFRATLDREGVTDMAGVPYTYELLERLGFRNDPPAALRVMTQAGGRLSPELVRTYAGFAADRRMRFFVMYGQTEATARMAYLPPDLALEHSDCIGIAIPRGSFELRDENGLVITKPGQPGELIYRGPNVMMGYAQNAADLAHGPSLDTLATGDIATRQADGLYRIVGRTSRFNKIAGLRVSFDEVEAIVRARGLSAHVTGDDRMLLIALGTGDPETVRQHVSLVCRLPLGSVFAWRPAEVPLLPSGKIDYQTIRRNGLELAAQAAELHAKESLRTVARLYTQGLNRADPDPRMSFVALGGDSLAYVTVSLGLEDMLGSLPRGWELMPIQDLQLLADSQPAGVQGPARLTIGTDVLLRLMAISLIFIGHGAPNYTEALRGGSSILFCLAGYSMALVQLPQLLEGRIGPILKGVAVRLVLPYFVLMTALLFASNAHKSISWYLLGSVFEMTAEQRGPLFSFWFIETLVHAIVLTCALFLIPSFRNQMRDRPFPTVLALIVLATLLRWGGAGVWRSENAISLTIDGWLYAFFIGWAVYFAQTGRQKILVLVLTAGLAFEQFGFWTGRAYWLTFAVAALVAMPSLSINRRIGHVLVYIAGATYFMYLAHALVVHVVHFKLDPGPFVSIALIYVGSLTLGIAYAEAWRRLVIGAQRAFSRMRRAA